MSRILLALIILISFNSCHVGRFFTRNFANITDHKIFPYTPLEKADAPFLFEVGNETALSSLKLRNDDDEMLTLDKYLSETRTTGFLVIRNDSILFEQYYRGYDEDRISNIFSVSKSITALLVGIAVDEGAIASIDDPIVKYIPSLNDAAPEFKELTIEHLLNMRAGFDFQEKYLSPFADVAKLYYGTHQLKQIQKLKFKYPPNAKRQYQSICTSILGVAVENATGKKLGDYMHEKIWLPLGMENYGSWSIDDKKHQSPKAFCCLNTTARDLAKIARLYLNRGQWEGKQIVSAEWIDQCTTPNVFNDCYQYQWYSAKGVARVNKEVLSYPDSLSAVQGATKAAIKYAYPFENDETGQWNLVSCYDDYFANGILGQYIYANPKKNIIIIRLGEKRDDNYLKIFRIIAKML